MVSSVHRFSRRRILGAAAGLAAIGSPVTWASEDLLATPWQTPGPFYPRNLPLDADADLARVAGRGEQASGVITHVFGRVLDPAGKPLKGVRVEIWQCDAQGFYHHPGDRGGRADPNFQGFGRTQANDEGAYRFRTIKPVSYPGRTPHIHFAIGGPQVRPFTTQMYVAGEAQNLQDVLYRRLGDEAARERCTVVLKPAPEIEPQALAGQFDIVMGRDFLSG